MIISISGASGSGKSTVLNKLRNFFTGLGYEVIIEEEDSFFFMKAARFLLGNKNFEKNFKTPIVEKFYQDTNRNLKEIVVIYLYAFLIWSESFAFYLFRNIFRPKTIFLKDRYIYDYLVTIEQNYQFKSNLIKRLFLSFPKPFLGFVIDSSFQKIFERNKENQDWLKYSGKFEKSYLKILEKYKKIAKEKNLFIINNDNKSDDAANSIKKAFFIKLRFDGNSSLVILGIDGTGKSTLSKNLEKYFTALSLCHKTVHFYHNSFLYRFLLWLGVFKKQEETAENLQKNMKKAIKASKDGKSLPWALFHYTDGFLQEIYFRLRYPDCVLIFDRYFHDFIVSFKHYRVPHRKIFEKILPKKKNIICLVCDPKICFERKPENSLEFFREAYENYSKLINKYKIESIDTTQIDEQEVFSRVISYLSRI